MAVIDALPQIQGVEERFQLAIEDSLKTNQIELQATLNDTFSQITDRLDATETRPPPITEQDPGMGAQGINNPLPDPHYVLSRYFWVDKSVVQSIADGEFDIHDHQEQEPRAQHNRKIAHGVHFPADGGKPELVTTRTEM